MKLTAVLRTSTVIASTALLGLALSVGAPTSAAADKVIPMPSGLCTWNYAAPTTDILFSRLAARDDFGSSMGYVAANCPTSLCEADWTGEGAKATIELLAGREYFGQLVGTLGQSCPDVALLLTEGATASTVNVPSIDRDHHFDPSSAVTPSEPPDNSGTGGEDPEDDGDQGNDNGQTDNPGNHYGRDGNPGNHYGRDGNPGNHYGQIDNPGKHLGQVDDPEGQVN